MATQEKGSNVDVETPRYNGEVRPVNVGSSGGQLAPYIPSEELRNAVNVTILLQTRPLLLKGEPGSGKTRLAQAVASELGLNYYFWPIKSTSRARDGLYTFDAVARLQDAHLQAKDEHEGLRANNLHNYIRYGPLGQAFRDESNKRPVVLIDEIDKADIDFPNDLLLELDEQVFEITETGESVPANMKPIIFITSNDEKDLPDAFLRRCLFYYIEFPRERLADIVNAHFGKVDPELVRTVVARFLQLRDQMDKDKKRGKKPSTSELIDWFAALHYGDPEHVQRLLAGELPYPEVLLKTWEDYRKYYTLEFEARAAAATVATNGSADAAKVPITPS